jgi:hypothetical protein
MDCSERANSLSFEDELPWEKEDNDVDENRRSTEMLCRLVVVADRLVSFDEECGSKQVRFSGCNSFEIIV